MVLVFAAGRTFFSRCMVLRSVLLTYLFFNVLFKLLLMPSILGWRNILQVFII